MEIEMKLAKEEKDILSIHQIMHDAFREYSGHGVPSSAMNETVQAIGEAIQNGTEYALALPSRWKSVRFGPFYHGK